MPACGFATDPIALPMPALPQWFVKHVLGAMGIGASRPMASPPEHG